jgi:hypothetical protein
MSESDVLTSYGPTTIVALPIPALLCGINYKTLWERETETETESGVGAVVDP